MFLHGIGPGEKVPPVGNPDTHLARGSQGQGFSCYRGSGGCLRVWGACSQVSVIFLGVGGHGMYLLWLGSREQDPPDGNPDTSPGTVRVKVVWSQMQ